MFEMYSGVKEEKDIIKFHSDEIELLRHGGYQKFIPLNGGSDTRKAAREYWKEWAMLLNIKYSSFGCMVILGSEEICNISENEQTYDNFLKKFILTQEIRDRQLDAEIEQALMNNLDKLYS